MTVNGMTSNHHPSTYFDNLFSLFSSRRSSSLSLMKLLLLYGGLPEPFDRAGGAEWSLPSFPPRFEPPVQAIQNKQWTWKQSLEL